jgi:hypothetical protein
MIFLSNSTIAPWISIVCQKGGKGKSHRHTESAVINLAGGHLFRTQKVRDEFVQNLADVCNNLRSRSNCSDLHQHAKVTNYE